MRNKPKPTPSDPSAEDPELLQRIDNMLSTELESPKAASPPAAKPKKTAEPELSFPLPKEIEAYEPKAKDETPVEADPETSVLPPENLVPKELDDTVTDKAVDEIVIQESDELLALEDARNEVSHLQQPAHQNAIRITWLILALLLVVLAVILSRYKFQGLR